MYIMTKYLHNSVINMVDEFDKKVTKVYWSYRWILGDRPKVFFSNPKVSMNVIFTLDELERVVERTDKENNFIPVPRHVYESALKSIKDRNNLAA